MIRRSSTRFAVLTSSVLGSAAAIWSRSGHRHRSPLDAQLADLGPLAIWAIALDHAHARRANRRLHARAFFFQLGRVARVADDHLALVQHQQIAVVAGEAGQIGDVGEVGHQQGVEPLLAKLAAQLVASGGVLAHGSRASGGRHNRMAFPSHLLTLPSDFWQAWKRIPGPRQGRLASRPLATRTAGRSPGCHAAGVGLTGMNPQQLEHLARQLLDGTLAAGRVSARRPPAQAPPTWTKPRSISIAAPLRLSGGRLRRGQDRAHAGQDLRAADGRRRRRAGHAHLRRARPPSWHRKFPDRPLQRRRPARFAFRSREADGTAEPARPRGRRHRRHQRPAGGRRGPRDAAVDGRRGDDDLRRGRGRPASTARTPGRAASTSTPWW